MSKEKDSNISDIISGTILFILVITVWYLSWLYIDSKVISLEKNMTDIEARGLFGDKFGAINSLFSSLAFAGIIFTIFLQKRELKLQREEMEETRGEFIKQNNTLIQQKFENTFFQLLQLLNSNIDSIDLRNVSTNIITNNGRDCFKQIFKYYRQFIHQDIFKTISSKNDISNATKEQVEKSYNKIYESYKSDLSHYYRTLYHIIKFIDNSSVTNKKQYTTIVRAQLSSYEQILLFYNCLHPNGREKFKPLIEKYALFKNIDSNLIINKDHKNEYEKCAFGK